MRKFLILIFILAITSVCVAQSIKGGLAVGLNISQVDGDEVFGYHKYGINAGPMAIIPIGKNFSASIETAYSQKGSYESPQSADSLTGEYKLTLDYVEVPLLFQYTDKDIFRIGTGFSWGRLVNYKEFISSRYVTYTPDGPVKKNDVDYLIDLQIKIYRGFHFNFRYSYSVGKIRTVNFQNIFTGYSWSRKQFNNDLLFGLIYVFKDSKTVKDKKKTNPDKIN